MKKVDLTSLINRGNSTDRLVTKVLTPGESMEGALYYEIGGDEEPSGLTLSYKGYADGASRDYDISLAPSTSE